MLHAGEGEGGVCPHYPCRGVPRAACHVSCVDRVLRELESCAVGGEFLLCVWGKERGWSKRNQLSLLALNLFRREAELAELRWLGEEGRGDLRNSALSSLVIPTDKRGNRRGVLCPASSLKLGLLPLSSAGVALDSLFSLVQYLLTLVICTKLC